MPPLSKTFDLPEQRPSDYERHGTTPLFAALDIATGKVTAECHGRQCQQDFLRFLQIVEAALPSDAGEIHLVLQNYGTHKTAKVVRWFARHSRYQLHLTPTSGSWVNHVECRLADITLKTPGFTPQKKKTAIQPTFMSRTRDEKPHL